MTTVNVQVNEAQLSNFDSTIPDRALLEQAAMETLEYHKAKANTELTLVLTDDVQIKELNRQFLGIEEPTDVLAFPAGEVDLDTGTRYLGDVVISFPRALAQANDRGHTVEAELQLLAVHGVLHLLGYDHVGGSQKEIMWKAQAEILNNLGQMVDSLKPY